MNEGIFNSSDLIKCYAPPSLGQVMAGNKVMLRSGGPKMTVCEDGEINDKVLCVWETENGKLEFYKFHLRCLTCWNAE